VKREKASQLRDSTAITMAIKFARRISTIWSDQRGVAAIEFAFFAGFLSLAILNVADVSIYLYQCTEAEDAAQGDGLHFSNSCWSFLNLCEYSCNDQMPCPGR
jgi:hypothetical protein